LLVAEATAEVVGMSALDFVKQYEAALATQHWEAVSPLIHENASVAFSDGSVHRGKTAVRAAYERNFDTIEDEQYRITNVHWLLDSDQSAAYMFDFFWTGNVRGQAASGAGRGTAVLVFEGDRWQLLAEHLGPYPR
jgi:ketosteroid isomerase-like protein